MTDPLDSTTERGDAGNGIRMQGLSSLRLRSVCGDLLEPPRLLVTGFRRGVDCGFTGRIGIPICRALYRGSGDPLAATLSRIPVAVAKQTAKLTQVDQLLAMLHDLDMYVVLYRKPHQSLAS